MVTWEVREKGVGWRPEGDTTGRDGEQWDRSQVGRLVTSVWIPDKLDFLSGSLSVSRLIAEQETQLELSQTVLGTEHLPMY